MRKKVNSKKANQIKNSFLKFKNVKLSRKSVKPKKLKTSKVVSFKLSFNIRKIFPHYHIPLSFITCQPVSSFPKGPLSNRAKLIESHILFFVSRYQVTSQVFAVSLSKCLVRHIPLSPPF